MAATSVFPDFEPRWDTALARRVVALRIVSSFAMGALALGLPAVGPDRGWLALILILGVPLTSALVYAFADRGHVLVRMTAVDSGWVAVVVLLFPGVYFEAMLVALVMLAFVANESHRALLATSALVVVGLGVAGVVHEPTNWIRLLGVFVLLLPLLMFVASVQNERDLQHRLRMRHRTEHDGLTGLRNRTGLAAVLETHEVTSLIAVDLDGFKDINDTLGHEAGDELLIVLAERLDAVIGDRGALARVGGDEFTIAVFIEDAAALANDVLRACRRRVALGDVDVSIGASLGIAAAVSGVDGAELLRRADLAMYDAKRSQGGIRQWTDATRSASRARVELSGEVERAFEDGQFQLHYQPIVDIHSGDIVDVEGLLRWDHPVLGMINPESFLELIEGIGRRSTMDRLVFDQAAALAARLPASIGVSVNVSAGSLMRSSLPVALEASLLRSRVDPGRFTVEVIEDEMVDEQSTARHVLTTLGEMGVGIAIDDFGTGHSSLSRLRHLPVTSLKIDRSFVGGVVASDDDRAIVAAVAELGAALDLVVVAEGVESAAVREALLRHRIRVDRLQGYGLAVPMPADELVDHVARSVQAKHPAGVVP
ncbi:MAG: bifunctional diguanylate cyclase/phosphodiesterase [Actinomycetota bacterium]